MELAGTGKRALSFDRHEDSRKEPSREEVVLSGLVDNAEQTALGGVGVRKQLVEPTDDKGRPVASIAEAQHVSSRPARLATPHAL